jgi:hypothetical protein
MQRDATAGVASATCNVEERRGEKKREDIAAAPPMSFDLENTEPKKPSAHHEFVNAFDSLFRERTGSGATWGKAQHGQAKELLKKHGLEECVKRARRLFAEVWWFTKDSTPTLGALVLHFDDLAAPQSRETGRSFP